MSGLGITFWICLIQTIGGLNIGDFGFGIQSTSHIVSIWNTIKSKIKGVYNIIPNKNIIRFIREAEFKFKLIKKTRGKNK